MTYISYTHICFQITKFHIYLENNVVVGVIHENTKETQVKRKNQLSEKYRVRYEEPGAHKWYQTRRKPRDQAQHQSGDPQGRAKTNVVQEGPSLVRPNQEEGLPGPSSAGSWQLPSRLHLDRAHFKAVHPRVG